MVREQQVDAIEQQQRQRQRRQLAEELELLAPVQRARLEGSSILRRLARGFGSFVMLFMMPLAGCLFTAFALARYLDDLALAVGFVVLVPLAIAGMVVTRRLDRAGTAAELERKRRAVASVRQLDVSSVSSTSSVAVPVMSSVHQPK